MILSDGRLVPLRARRPKSGRTTPPAALPQPSRATPRQSGQWPATVWRRVALTPSSSSQGPPKQYALRVASGQSAVQLPQVKLHGSGREAAVHFYLTELTRQSRIKVTLMPSVYFETWRVLHCVVLRCGHRGTSSFPESTVGLSPCLPRWSGDPSRRDTVSRFKQRSARSIISTPSVSRLRPSPATPPRHALQPRGRPALPARCGVS